MSGEIKESKTGAMNAEELGKSVAELVSMGCKFVVEGDVFNATVELLEKLLIDGNPDREGQAFLIQLREALLRTSKPVKDKLGTVDPTSPRVAVVKTLPADMPKPPAGVLRRSRKQ